LRYAAGQLARNIQRRRGELVRELVPELAPDAVTAGTGLAAAAGTGLAAGAGLAAAAAPAGSGHAAATDRFLRHRGLIIFSSGCAMAEVAVLTVLAPAARSLAPQVTAPPPLAVFHDLRWLFGYNRSWIQFAAGALILLAGRAALNTVMVRLAWPRDLRAPRPAVTFAVSMAFTLVAVILLIPITTLIFGVAVLPFSWPFLAAVPVLLAIALPLSHGGVTPGWWRRLPPLRAACWVLACFLEYSVLAVVITRLPAAWIVPVAGLAGFVNARAWYGLTAAMARPYPRQHPLLAWIPVAPLAAISVFALAIGGTRVIFEMTTVSPARTGLAAASAGIAAAAGRYGGQALTVKVPEGKPAVLVIGGFGSTCCHSFRSLRGTSDMTVEQFSYLGLNAAGKPIPQGRSASNLPMQALGDMIASQVWRLHAQTGKPVDLVAESEGTLGVYAMFARHPRVPVGSVALLSPIVAPGQVSFPQPGRQGPGMAGGYALGILDRLVGELSPFGAAGAERLIDSVSSVGAQYAAQDAARVMSERWLAVVPLADAVTLPVCSMPQNVLFVSAFHGGLLGDPAVLATVRNFLDGQEVSGGSSLRTAAQLVSAAAAAWRMPLRTAPSPPCPA
jgi:hypothetical protein